MLDSDLITKDTGNEGIIDEEVRPFPNLSNPYKEVSRPSAISPPKEGKTYFLASDLSLC